MRMEVSVVIKIGRFGFMQALFAKYDYILGYRDLTIIFNSFFTFSNITTINIENK
jgi:hypothetical protein